MDLELTQVWARLQEASERVLHAMQARRDDPAADVRPALDRAAQEAANATAELRQMISGERGWKPRERTGAGCPSHM